MRQVVIDETSRRRGHKCLAILVDAERRQVVNLLEGRSSQVLKMFARVLEKHCAGDDDMTNFRPLHYTNNLAKGKTYPGPWQCAKRGIAPTGFPYPSGVCTEQIVSMRNK